jgi:ligand-binding sensor domain-containing protein
MERTMGILKRTGPAAGLLAAVVWMCLSAPTAGAADVKFYTSANGLPSDWVTALAVAPDGKVWAGTGNSGVALLDPKSGRVSAYRVKDGLPSDEATSIALFGGKVYVGTANGIGIFDGSRWESVRKTGTVTFRNVRLAASPDGKELWASSVYLSGGTVRFDGKEWKFMGGEGRGLFNDIEGFGFLPDGVLMGSGQGTVYLHRGADVVPLPEGLPPTSIFSVAAWNGNAVAGTAAGLFERAGGKWVPVRLPAGIDGRPVFALSTRGGLLAVGTQEGVVLLTKGKPPAVFTHSNGLPQGKVTAVAAGDGFVAAGTARGLAIISE